MPLKFFPNFATWLEKQSLEELKRWKRNVDQELEQAKRQVADLQEMSDDLAADIYTLTNMRDSAHPQRGNQDARPSC